MKPILKRKLTCNQPQYTSDIRISKMNFKTTIITIIKEVKGNTLVMKKKTGSDSRQTEF